MKTSLTSKEKKMAINATHILHVLRAQINYLLTDGKSLTLTKMREF